MVSTLFKSNWCISFKWHSGKISDMTHTHTHTQLCLLTQNYSIMHWNVMQLYEFMCWNANECVCVSHSAMLSIESAVLKFTDRIAESERLRERRGEKQHTTKPLKLKMMMMMTIPIMKRCFLCMAAWEKKSFLFRIPKLTQCERQCVSTSICIHSYYEYTLS